MMEMTYLENEYYCTANSQGVNTWAHLTEWVI